MIEGHGGPVRHRAQHRTVGQLHDPDQRATSRAISLAMLALAQIDGPDGSFGRDLPATPD